jgi:hypothetical protein
VVWFCLFYDKLTIEFLVFACFIIFSKKK